MNITLLCTNLAQRQQTAMTLWNKLDLGPPAFITFRDSKNKINAQLLYNVTQEGYVYFRNNKYLLAEISILSRLIYRMKQKFRSAKDFKAIEKVQKGLENYLRLNICSAIESFKDLRPSDSSPSSYFPTKNVLNYLLVRLQGLAKLCVRIVESTKIAAYLSHRRLNTGHFYNVTYIMLAITSRIYVLIKHMTKFTCDYYNKLIMFLGQLENPGASWLPADYKLPKDLKEWLDVTWLDSDDEIIEIFDEVVAPVTKFFDLVDSDDEEIEFCDEYIMVKDDDKPNFGNQLRGFNWDADIGEIVDNLDDSLIILGEDAVDESLNVTRNGKRKSDVEDSSNTPKRRKVADDMEIGEVVEIPDTPVKSGGEGCSNELDEVVSIPDSLVTAEECGEVLYYTINDSIVESPKPRKNKEKGKFPIQKFTEKAPLYYNRAVSNIKENEFISLDTGTPIKSTNKPKQKGKKILQSKLNNSRGENKAKKNKKRNSLLNNNIENIVTNKNSSPKTAKSKNKNKNNQIQGIGLKKQKNKKKVSAFNDSTSSNKGKEKVLHKANKKNIHKSPKSPKNKKVAHLNKHVKESKNVEKVRHRKRYFS